MAIPKLIVCTDSTVKIESPNSILKGIESRLSKFKIIQLKILSHSLENKRCFWTSLLKYIFLIEYLKLYLLRLYINNSLNKILIDHDLRKLIKSEIFKVPGDIFSEFLRLYKDIMQELEEIDNSEDFSFGFIIDQITLDSHEKRDNYSSH